jgi:hypothetical protein
MRMMDGIGIGIGCGPAVKLWDSMSTTLCYTSFWKQNSLLLIIIQKKFETSRSTHQPLLMHDACTKLNYAKEASFIFVVMLCYFEASGGKSYWHGENRRLHVRYDERVEEMEKRKRKGKA